MNILLRGLPLLALPLIASVQEPGIDETQARAGFIPDRARGCGGGRAARDPHQGIGPGMGRPGGPRMGQGSPLLRHAKDLGLSEEQITRLKAQAEARKDELRKVHEAHREAMRAVHEGDKSDAAKQRVQAAEEALKGAMEKARAEDLAVLTPEQQEKAKALKEKFSGSKGGPGRRPGQ